jgi:hypothetical protein
VIQTPVESKPSPASPVEAVRLAIWRLFQEGYVDEDMATAGLLAVDLGARRAQQRKTMPAGTPHASSRDRRRRTACQLMSP